MQRAVAVVQQAWKSFHFRGSAPSLRTGNAKINIMKGCPATKMRGNCQLWCILYWNIMRRYDFQPVWSSCWPFCTRWPTFLGALGDISEPCRCPSMSNRCIYQQRKDVDSSNRLMRKRLQQHFELRPAEVNQPSRSMMYDPLSHNGAFSPASSTISGLFHRSLLMMRHCKHVKESGYERQRPKNSHDSA